MAKPRTRPVRMTKRTQLFRLVPNELSQADRSQPPQALKSTGPTTAEGKQRSRCNAVRHGLTAETVIAALEDSEDYEAFEAAVISDYEAKSAVERELVLRLASVLWRLRRATGIETALFESATEDFRKHERGLHARTSVGPQISRSEIDHCCERYRNPTLRRETRSALMRRRISWTASCAWQICRLAPSIASVATNTCCGGKLDRLCLR